MDKEPVTVNEALSSSERGKWKKAMEIEMKSIQENDVWDLVELPKHRKAIGNKWVFNKCNIGVDGSVERYKARLVAQGFSQRYCLDYDETFCLVVRFNLLQTLISLAVQNGLKLHQMVVTAAFLNGDLKEEVCMNQPEGFIEDGKEHLVSKLKHSLYGLKQSPRCWNSLLDMQMKKLHLVQSKFIVIMYLFFNGRKDPHNQCLCRRYCTCWKQ